MTAPSQEHLTRAHNWLIANPGYPGWAISLAAEFAAVEREAIEAYELERLQAEQRALGDPRDRVSTSSPEKTS